MNINKILAAEPAGLSRGGAHMGAQSRFDTSNPRLYVQRLTMIDHAYDAAGVYWGGPTREPGAMFCGFNDYARVYARAKCRVYAIQQIRAGFPAATFHRG